MVLDKRVIFATIIFTLIAVVAIVGTFTRGADLLAQPLPLQNPDGLAIISPNDTSVILKDGSNALVGQVDLNTKPVFSTKYNNNVWTVAPGKNVEVAEFTITMNQSYKQALKQVDFYDKNNKDTKIDKVYTYQLKGTAQGVRNTYNQTCKLVNVSKIDCNPNLNGTEIYNYTTWNPIALNTDLGKGTYTIGVFTDVSNGDYVEWIPTIMNTTITSWSIYVADSNLLVWYNESEGSGTTLTNAVNPGTRDGKLIGTLGWNISTLMSGKQVRSAQSGTNWINVTNGVLGLKNANGFSTNVWVNTSLSYIMVWDDNGDNILLRMNNATGNVWQFDGFPDGTSNDRLQATSTVNWVLNNWTMITWGVNATTQWGYINGIYAGQVARSGSSSESAPFKLGYRPAEFANVNTSYGGIGIWNRSLTAAEVTELYNLGLGTYYNSTSLAPYAALVTTTYCRFAGRVTDASSNPLNATNITIIKQESLNETYLTYTNVSGDWNYSIVNNSNNYMVLARLNNSLAGGYKTYINSTC